MTQAALPSALTAPERWTLVATVLGSGMAFLDGTVVNVALPALQRDLGASAAGVQWVVNAYLLTLAALTLAGGALGDLYGRRRVYGLGVALFAAASLACGLSPSLTLLVLARGVQGVGAALLVPGSLAMIGAIFAPGRRGRGVGLWSASSSVVTLAGPLLGGVMVDQASWRWVFLLNLPLALGVLLTLPRVPETRSPGARPDWPGAVAATLALAALASGFTRAGESGWDLPAWGALGLAALAAGAFVWQERRSPHPMLPLDLFRRPAFSGTNLLTLLLYGALGALGTFLPLNLIGARGFTATRAGAALLPLSVLLALLSGPAGAWADRHGPRLFLTLGPLLAGVGFALLGWAGSSLGLLPGALLLGLGMALTVAPLSSAVLASVPQGQSGVASGVNNAVARAASLIAIAALGLVLVGGYRSALGARLAASGLTPAQVSEVQRQAPQLTQARLPAGASPAQQAALRSAFSDAFLKVTLACAGLAALGGLVGWRSLRPGAAGRPETGTPR